MNGKRGFLKRQTEINKRGRIRRNPLGKKGVPIFWEAIRQGTFGLKPPSSTPKNQLKRVEIPVLGLDCKACCLAAYEIVARLDGVEQATASFKEGRISALIDPKRIQITQIEAALKERGVTLNR